MTAKEPKKPTSKKESPSVARSLIEAKEPCPYVLVISPDITRRSRFTSKFLETFTDEKNSEALITQLDCREYDNRMLASVREVSQSLSLFSARQFLVLQGIDELKAHEAKDILDIVAQSSPGNSVLAIASKVQVTTNLYKFFEKQGTVVSFEELKGFELKRWASRECVNQGISKIDERALDLLLEMSQGDVDYLVKLIEVASLYSEEGAVTEADIGKLFRISLSHSEFALADEILAGNSYKAKMLLAELLREGKNPFGLIAIMSRSVMQVMTVRLELDRGNQESRIRDLLGISPWQYNKVVTHARRMKPLQLKRVLSSLLKADVRLKSRSVAVEDILNDVITAV